MTNRRFKRICAFLSTFILILSPVNSVLSASRGPVSSYKELQELIASAQDGDVILVAGDIICDPSSPLVSSISVHVTSASSGTATLLGLQLRDAQMSFSNIRLSDTLDVRGTSHIHLEQGVSVTGGDGAAGVAFCGNGSLIIDSRSEITGGSESAGVSIDHQGGELYASLEGRVTGGSGKSGGPGVMVAPLSSSGALMISGSIYGGEGENIGGHALNLYGLSGNAYITIDGNLQGGSGVIGGDGVQLVSATDSVNVGISGKIKGGSGEAYGGDAIILMNAEGASSIHLSGEFAGGNAASAQAQPGTALQMVGNMTSLRTRVNDCLLEDGSYAVPSQPHIQVTPLPGITPSTDDVDILEGISPTPAPFPDSSPTPLPFEATPSEAQPAEERLIADTPED